eukprot:TRINITY_DN2926_c0_g1_i10.p2 TRINITY_DN2926_c0_g1~~TRINITY_DN2926_c0_g1_i10.p2  ORF type:complete len:139 (-),score=33.24 TRINITY_DN2926_c0_g1_i10:1226-1594(-)
MSEEQYFNEWVSKDCGKKKGHMNPLKIDTIQHEDEVTYKTLGKYYSTFDDAKSCALDMYEKFKSVEELKLQRQVTACEETLKKTQAKIEKAMEQMNLWKQERFDDGSEEVFLQKVAMIKKCY